MPAIEQLDRISMSVTSPDKTVKIDFAAPAGLIARLRPGSVRRHSEESLSRQVQAALLGAMRGYREAVRTILEPDAAEPADTPLDRELAKQRVRAGSPRGAVDIDWHGSSDIRVRFRPRVLDRFDETELAAELNTAIAEVVSAYGRGLLRIHENDNRN